MKKKYLVILLFTLILLIISLRFTFAINIREEEVTGTSDVTYNIDIEDVRETDITVAAGKTREFDFVITNNSTNSLGY